MENRARSFLLVRAPMLIYIAGLFLYSYGIIVHGRWDPLYEKYVQVFAVVALSIFPFGYYVGDQKGNKFFYSGILFSFVVSAAFSLAAIQIVTMKFFFLTAIAGLLLLSIHFFVAFPKILSDRKNGIVRDYLNNT